MEEEKFKKELDKAIVSRHYKFTDYKKKENEEFCIFIVDTVLLHPEIRDHDLIEEERYYLSTSSELSRGQYKFDICFHSKIEMLKVYEYLVSKGYKYSKIYMESSRNTEECKYTLNNIKNGNQFLSFIGCQNILSVTINLKDLDKFKKDIQDIRKDLGYRNVWRSETLYNYFKNYKIVD